MINQFNQHFEIRRYWLNYYYLIEKQYHIDLRIVVGHDERNSKFQTLKLMKFNAFKYKTNNKINIDDHCVMDAIVYGFEKIDCFQADSRDNAD